MGRHVPIEPDHLQTATGRSREDAIRWARALMARGVRVVRLQNVRNVASTAHGGGKPIEMAPPDGR